MGRIILLTLMVIFMGHLSFAQEQKAGAPLPVQGRSVIETKFGIVATSQPLASMAGVQILERGGNAIDAAIAANATLGLMEPTSNGIGGDLFAIVYDAKTKKLYGLNSSGWSPKAMSRELLASKGITTMPERGVWTVTVPGAVAGWNALHEKFGTLPFSTILAPAMYYAENGFPVNQVTAGLWSRSQKFLSGHPNSAATYLINGQTPKAGQVFRNPDLAASLKRIADANGRDGYYKGETAQKIVDIEKEFGGVMTLEDLADFQPEWVTPISTTYRGWTVYEIPPNTQGIAALMMLNLMEQFPMSEYGFHSVKAMHTMIEAKKLAYADMLRYVGDPRFSQIPVEQMLDKNHAAERAKLIGDRASCKTEPSVFPGVTGSKGNDTIYMSAIDKDGNIVSLIQSNYSGFGSGLVPKGGGFMLQNRGALFSLQDGHANLYAPNKRPLHTIIPGFVTRDGEPWLSYGVMGGAMQPQGHTQVLANMIDFGMNPQEAGDFARWQHYGAGTPDDPDLEPGGEVSFESGIAPVVVDELKRRGHRVTPSRPLSGYGGYQAIQRDAVNGCYIAATEMRFDGQAAGY